MLPNVLLSDETTLELPLYHYHALSPNHIRVLKLLPDATSRMTHVDLRRPSSAFKYVALSYTWGSSTETFPFQCDAQKLPVRENLLYALSRLKNVLETPIWIDAMCINQSDDVEKMGQIQLMTDIYRSADSVLIWLGEEIPEIKGTAEQLRTVTAALKALKTSTAKSLDAILQPSFIKGIRHLLNSTWWPRLWVLQEATLARDATFICGSQLISWKGLSALTKQIKRLDLYTLFRGHNHRLDFCDGFTEILNVEIVRHTHSVTLASDLLRICRQRICFDPCDRVYGIIGLIDPSVREGFTWEPGEKVEDLYPPFVAILLQLDAVALLLSLNETTQRNPKLPSWCPDIHYRSVTNVLADHEGYHAGFTIQTHTRIEFDTEDSRKIRIKGIVADAVKTIGQDEWAGDKAGEESDDVTQGSMAQHNILLLQKYRTLAKTSVPEKDLWRIFVGDMIGNEDSKLHWLAGFSSIHDRLVRYRWKDEAKRYRDAYRDLQAWSPNVGEPSAAIEFYLKIAGKICLGRQLFTTVGGRVGLGPRSMSVGDYVCILKGTKVPFVLKRDDALSDTYDMRGEAYVQGMMYGEYLKVKRDFGWITLV